MKVALIGGVAASLKNFRGTLIRSLVEDGHQVVAAAGENYLGCAEEIGSLGAVFFPLPLSRASISPIESIRLYFEICRFLKRERPDVVLNYTIKPVIFGALAAQHESIPRVCCLITGLGYAFNESDIKSRIIGFIVRFLYRFVLKKVDLVIFQNQGNANLFSKLKIINPKIPSSIVDGSGVDVDRFSVTPLPDSLSFLMIARLLRDKGVMEYAEAAQRLRRSQSNTVVRLVGGLDPNPSSVSADTLSKWVSNSVLEYLGVLEDVRPAISGCSVYILPSYSEGLPRTVLEAMAMGRAIITTDVPGCKETIKGPLRKSEDGKRFLIGSNGILIPVKNAQSLFEAMTYLTNNPRLVEEMGLVSRQIAVSRFSSKIIDEKMIQLITTEKN